MTDTATLATEPIGVVAIVAALKDILVERLGVGVPIDQINENAPLEDLGLDSVVLIELIAVVETQFDFVFLDSDLRASAFESLRALAEVVAERIRAPADTARLA
jgi:acyl carrier protein